MRIGVVALQGAVSEHLDVLAALGARPVKVRRPADLAGLAGIVVPGGESSAMARLGAPSGLYPAIRASGLPVLGTCAGLILLADTVLDAGALAGFDTIGGLDARVRRNGFGRQRESFEAIPEPAGGYAGAFSGPVAFIRAPRIVSVGPGVEVLARVAGEPVLVRQGRLLAATFHPEITGETAVHSLFLEGARTPTA